MKTLSPFTLLCAITMMASMIFSTAQADIVYVDFGDGNTAAATGTDFYNTTPDGGGNTSGLAVGIPVTANDLTDIDGTTATTIDVSLNSYNTGGGQLRFFNSAAHNGVAGFEDYAEDGYLINNHNSNTAGSPFGYVLSFSGLDASEVYDLSVWSRLGGNAATGAWSVTTGTGDSDVESFGFSGDDVSDWTSVAPDAAGNIVLTSEVTASGTFGNTTVAFASISQVATAVPEPSSASLLGLVVLGCLARRKRS